MSKWKRTAWIVAGGIVLVGGVVAAASSEELVARIKQLQAAHSEADSVEERRDIERMAASDLRSLLEAKHDCKGALIWVDDDAGFVPMADLGMDPAEQLSRDEHAEDCGYRVALDEAGVKR